jgi:UDP-N-acetylmuramyl pentapeptide phosphotransferase/UDP-N-acetylglucosamine-1-phosphate transferase
MRAWLRVEVEQNRKSWTLTINRDNTHHHLVSVGYREVWKEWQLVHDLDAEPRRTHLP